MKQIAEIQIKVCMEPSLYERIPQADLDRILAGIEEANEEALKRVAVQWIPAPLLDQVKIVIVK